MSPPLVPGEIIAAAGEIEINAGATAITLKVENTGDRPIQVGSHYHFAETNPALRFDRAAARGHRLDIPAGTAVRFEPGQGREVQLVPYGGAREVYGFRGDVMGKLDGKGGKTAPKAASKSAAKPAAAKRKMK